MTGDPSLGRRWWQGSIWTHGLHLHLIADSDNLMLTEPVTETTSEYRMVVLPGDPGNVGEIYGRSADKPLVATTFATPDLGPGFLNRFLRIM